MSKPPSLPVDGVDAQTQSLMRRAHGGSYAVWLRVQPIRPNQRALGASTLHRDFADAVLGRIVREVGGPAYVVVSSRGSQPCLYIRARFGTDFRELARSIHRLAGAMGYELVTLDATENAFAAIRAGL